MRKLAFYFSIGFLLCCAWACHSPKKNTITIATAANMQFVMEALCKEFTQQTNVECQLVVSSSGKLTAQLLAGAPYDIFASADLKYPNELFHKGFTTSPPKVYAKGKLVLWTLNDSLKLNLKSLENPNTHHIAIANPKTAPFGIAAMQVLSHCPDSVKEKLIYGESIAQVNQFITTQSVPVGFTALSVALTQQKGHYYLLPTQTYKPIDQGIVVLKQQNTKLSQQFYDFVFSEKGKKVLKSYGCL